MFKSGEKVFLIDTKVFHEIESVVNEPALLRRLNGAARDGFAFELGGKPKSFLVAQKTLEGLVSGREEFVEELFFDRVRYAIRPSDLRSVPGVYEEELILAGLNEGVCSGDLLKVGKSDLYVGSAKSLAGYVIDQPEFLVRDAVTAMLRRGWLELLDEGAVIESAVRPFDEYLAKRERLKASAERKMVGLSERVDYLRGKVVELRRKRKEDASVRYSLARRVAKSEGVIAALAGELEEARGAIGEREELKQVQELSRIEILRVRDDYAALEREAIMLRGDGAVSKARISEYELRIKELEGKLEASERERAERPVERVVEPTPSVARKNDGVIEKLRGQIRRLTATIERYETREEDDDNAKLQKDDAADDRVVSLEAQLENLRMERADAFAKIDFLWEEVQILEASLAEYEPIVETVRERFASEWDERKERYALVNKQLSHSRKEPRVGGIIVPERSQLHIVYDLLHYMELNGERLSTDDVVGMLDRAHTHKEGSRVQEDSKVRYFERFKQRLKRIGVEFVVDFENGAERSYFVVPNPGAQKEYVNGLIVMRELYGSSQWKHLVGLAREQGVSGLYIAADKSTLLDERLSAFRILMGERAKLPHAESYSDTAGLRKTVQPGA